MKTEIYYFSGTGNSLFVARELQKRIPGAVLIPMAGLLKNKTIQARGQAVGFVFPVHALTIPIAVKQFIRKIELPHADYVFAIATREGTVFHGFKTIDRLLTRKHKRLDAHFILRMYGNDARHGRYVVPQDEDILTLEQAVLEKLDWIAAIIKSRAISREKDTTYTIESAANPLMKFLIERTVLLGMNIAEHIGGVNYFYHDDKCTGCGICAKVCLSRKIRMSDGKPVWQKNVLCYMCFACLNYCPKHSVQIRSIPGVKSYSRENGRYTHPYATANEISLQKEEK